MRFIILLVTLICVLVSAAAVVSAQQSDLARCVSACRLDLGKAQCHDLCLQQLSKQPAADVESMSTSMSEQTQEINDAEAWGRYRSEVMRLLRGTASHTKGKESFDGLQLVTSGIDVDGDSGDNLLQQFAQSPVDWSGTFSPMLGGRSYADRYFDFLMSLSTDNSYDSSNADLSARVDELEQQMNAQLFAVIMERAKCEGFYMALPDYFRQMTPFDRYATMYCPGYTFQNQNYKITVGRAEMLKREAFGGYKNYAARKAIGAFLQNPARSFLQIGSIQSFIANSNAGKLNKISLSVNSKTSFEESSFKQSGWSVSLIVVGGGQQKTSMKLTTKKDEFSLDFSAQSWTTITLVPDPRWYNGDVVRDWAQGPFNNGRTYSDFFRSPVGKLNMVPRTFYLVYKPKITMKVNHVDAEQMQKASSTTFGISIFGIGFNFGKNSRLAVAKEKDNVFKVEVESNSEVPQLFAVDNAILP